MKIYKKTLMISLITLLTIFSISPAFADTIKIGSKKFPESQLLAEMMSILIEEKTEHKVDRKFGLGGTLICFEALRTNSIDLYPEYTGTGLTAILKDNIQINDADKVYQKVSQGFKEKYNISWLKPFGFNNTYALAISKKLNIKNISELSSHLSELRVALSHEFINRSDGYEGLSKHYGFSFPNMKGMEHGLVYKAIESGQVDLTDAYSTDGNLIKYNLLLLKDDKKFFPPYYAAPIIRGEILKKYPEIEKVLNTLNNQINDQEIIKLNYQVEVKSESYEKVARQFLVEKKFIADNKAESKKENPIIKLTLQHIFLTIVATFFSILVGLPLGLLISRYKKLASPILSIAGVIQTIPSLAILGFMIPVFGIGTAPAIAALFLYGLLPIIRNTYTGITSVDPALKEAGKGMGMTQMQLMFKLELPLSTRIIMAGIRTATVINIGTATLAAFIGAGGLGELIVTGLTLNDNNLILSGAIPSAILALVVDFLLARLENILEPNGLKLKHKSNR
ncbi:MAG: ABC transporter permease subunit [Candidatus Sericytochromatia bacterium]|nr:ABC transporter permease subunit [Candidatus Sericytochromatia bacterium]